MYTVLIKSRYSKNYYTTDSLREIQDNNETTDIASRIIKVFHEDFGYNEHDQPLLVGKPKKRGSKYVYIWDGNNLEGLAQKFYFINESNIKSAYLEDDTETPIHYANDHGFHTIFDHTGQSILKAIDGQWYYYTHDKLPFPIMSACDS